LSGLPRIKAAAFPQQKVFQDVLLFPRSQRSVANAASYLLIYGLRPGFGFDHLVDCTTAWTLEKGHRTWIRHNPPGSQKSASAGRTVEAKLAIRARALGPKDRPRSHPSRAAAGVEPSRKPAGTLQGSHEATNEASNGQGEVIEAPLVLLPL
jgi:hypothetical protein